jgi:branched-chain amino acid transport system ATP-binding protein
MIAGDDTTGQFFAPVLPVEWNAGLALFVASRGYLMQNGASAISGPISELRDMSLMRELSLGGIAGQAS